jgi:APA family basic amino acid/polyamine antiporter
MTTSARGAKGRKGSRPGLREGRREEGGERKLLRVLGPFDATMVVAGGIIGAGIFTTPSVIASILGRGELVLLAWLVGAGVAVAGAFTFSDLAERLPRAGGTYAYLKAAFGPLPGFLFAWSSLFTINTGAAAFMGLAAGSYIVGLWQADPSLEDCRWQVQGAALGAIAFFTLVNACGVRQGARAQNLLTLLKLSALIGLAAAGLLLPAPAGSPAPLEREQEAGLGLFCLALLPVLFSYGGWQNVCNLAEEVRSPTRHLPLAILLGTGLAAALYLLFNGALLAQLGAEGMAATPAVGTALARKVLGEAAGALAGVAIALSALGVLNGFVLGTPRILYATARDGLFFPAFARLGERSRAPLRVLLLQAAVSAVYVLFADLRQILEGLVVVDWLFFALAGLAWFALVKGRSPLRAIIPALFVLVALAVPAGAVITSLAGDGKTALMGAVQLGILGCGALAYGAWFRR